MHPSHPPESSRFRPWLALAALLWVGGLVRLLSGLGSAGVPGWDEAGHAFAALRMADALRSFDLGAFWSALHRPDTYTGPGRLWMVPAFLVSSSFAAPRAATVVVWFLVIAGSGALARRLVEPPRRDEATFWTVVFGTSSWLGIEYARTAFQEAWCALTLLAAVFLWLRARRVGTWASAVALGLALGGAFVVKANYGAYAIGAVGFCALVDVLLRSPGVRTGRVALGALAGAALVGLWWFVLPVPFGLEMGREHGRYLVRFLSGNAEHHGYGPGYLLIVWALEGCPSPVVFVLQASGVVWMLARWRDPLARVAVVLTLIGFVAFAAYPLRIDRFLVPTTFALWLGAAGVSVHLTGRAGRRGPRVAAAILALAWITRGTLAAPISRAARVVEWSSGVEAVVLERASERSDPYRARPVPSSGPPGVEQVLDRAVRHLDARETFLWIGGTFTELSLWLVEWRLFQATGESGLLRRERDALKRDHFEGELAHADGSPYDETAFRQFAAQYRQVAVLDPPDPKARPREFEVRYAAWMQAHPGFELVAREALEIEVRPGDRRPFDLRFYRRRE